MAKRLRALLIASVLTVVTAVTLIGCSGSGGSVSKGDSKNLCYIMKEQDFFDFNTFIKESKYGDKSERTLPKDYKPVVADSLSMGETYYVVCYTAAATSDESNLEFRDGELRLSVEDGVKISDALEVNEYGEWTSAVRGASLAHEEQGDSTISYSVVPYGESPEAEFVLYVQFTAKSEAKLDVSYHLGSTTKKNTFGVANTSTATANIYFDKKISLSNLDISYLTSDTYVDGRYDAASLTGDVTMKVGKEYYMVITATMKSLITEGSNDKLKLNVKVSPLAVVDGTLEEAGSGDFTEKSNEEKTEKNISVTFKIPEPEEGDKQIRFIVKLTPVSLRNPTVAISFSGEQISVIGNGSKTEKSLLIDGEEKTSEGFEYRLSADKSYYILEGIGLARGSILYIPSQYEGKPVKEIDAEAFDGNKKIKSVEIAEGIEKIGNRAFRNCTNLFTVYFPSTAALGQHVLNGCSSITNLTVNLGGAQLKTLFGTSSILPPSLKTVTLKGDTQICDNAFTGGSKLEGISIPSTVLTVGSNAFSSCTVLNSLTIELGNQNFFVQSGILYKNGTNEILGSVAFFSGELSYPEGITAIPGGDMTGVTKITVPDTVTRFITSAKNLAPVEAMGPYFLFGSLTKTNLVSATVTTGTTAPAFNGAANLVTVVLPSNMTSVPSGAFSGCQSLKTVTLPSGINVINSKLFYNCKSLTSIVIPDAVMTIGEDAFYGCESLTEINIPSGVTVINEQAFAFCKKLTSVKLPNIGSGVPRYLFDGCESLTAVTFTGEIKYIYNGAFRNCVSLTAFTIPSTVMNISDYAFAGTGLTKVNIPASVSFIDDSAFDNCKSLAEFTVEDGNQSFSASGGLLYNADATKIVKVPEGISGKVTLGTKIKAIRKATFSGCEKMTELIIRGSICIEPGALSSCTALTKIHFNSKTIFTYYAPNRIAKQINVSDPSEAATLVKKTYADRYFGNPDLLNEG